MTKGRFIIEVFDTTAELSKGFINSSYCTIGEVTRSKPFFFETSDDIKDILDAYSKLLKYVLQPYHHGPLAGVYDAIRTKFFLHDSFEDFELISHIQEDPKPKVKEHEHLSSW